jgi:DNA-binding response OmpR family regulator
MSSIAPDTIVTPYHPVRSPGVLVIDDQAEVLSLIGRILSRDGYTPFLAMDGIEGMVLFEKHHDRIDVVILDWHLPEWSGRETLRRLTKRRPNLRVVLSTGDREAALDKTDRELFSCLLLKPFTPGELMLAVGALAPV